MEKSGVIVDVVNKIMFSGTLIIENGKILDIIKNSKFRSPFLIPGLIDSHIHIESSMLTPQEFARLATAHGTTAVVADPHEIANVLGIRGIDYMIEQSKKTPFNFYFGAPSCVPATIYETSGFEIDEYLVEKLLVRNDIFFLSEMMNFPGVIYDNKSVISKIEAAKKCNKPIDGHVPGIKGDFLKKYISAGISTDHECYTYAEAVEKIKLGMKILIREGSAAKNFDELIGLINHFPDKIMFCSDDKHPDDLVNGHLNLLIKRAIYKNVNPIDAIIACSLNPTLHYNLNKALLQIGDYADFVVIDNLNDFNVLETYIKGEKVAENGNALINKCEPEIINNFNTETINEKDINVKHNKNGKIKIIEAIDKQLITNIILDYPKVENGFIATDLGRDILKIVVVNRYKNVLPQVAFIKGFNLKSGAIASSVAHDSHNIVAVGVDDESIVACINEIIKNKGGIAVSNDHKTNILPLPVAGLMSTDDGYKVAKKYSLLNKYAHQMGSKLTSPFMTLSFMSLLVIPALKLSDKGLFDAKSFSFTDLYK